jgi:polyphenol oxidase
MILQNNGGNPPYYKFKLLSEVEGLVHGVFTRHGGVSLEPYATLNVGWSNGDAREAVRENLERVRNAMGVDRLVSGRQFHGDTIHLVDEEALALALEQCRQQDANYSAGDAEPPGTSAPSEAGTAVLVTPPGDALVTKLRGVGLLIKIADCQSIFLVDPVRGAIANIHSGWRGSIRAIAAKTLRFLRDRFGSRPEDILATVSPSLGPCCGEFRNYRVELPESFLPFQVRPEHFDFWAITRRQLLDEGLRSEHVEAAGICTVCGTGEFFSYRGERDTGRLAAVIAWKEDVED